MLNAAHAMMHDAAGGNHRRDLFRLHSRLNGFCASVQISLCLWLHWCLHRPISLGKSLKGITVAVRDHNLRNTAHAASSNQTWSLCAYTHECMASVHCSRSASASGFTGASNRPMSLSKSTVWQ